jgi:hypothetical protein
MSITDQLSCSAQQDKTPEGLFSKQNVLIVGNRIKAGGTS